MVLGLSAATSTSAVMAEEQPAAQASTDTSADRSGPSADEAERLLLADSVDPVAVHVDPDGTSGFVGTLGAPIDGVDLPATVAPAVAAEEHLDRYGALFGVEEPASELETTEVLDTSGGSHVVHLRQRVDGLPVLGGELAVSLTGDGALESVNGETTDATGLVPVPAEPASAAVATAVEVTARAHGVDAAALTAGTATEWLYDPALVGSPDPMGPRPVWRIEVSNGADIRELVLVDTRTGRVAAHVNQVMHALNRVVCDRLNRRGDPLPCRAGSAELTEAAPEPAAPFGRAEDAEAAFAHSGDTAAFFRGIGVPDLTRLIGSNAGDGAKRLRSTVRYCDRRSFDPRCPMRNAFWSGRAMFYGDNFPQADDVVAHELTHGVIQHTSNLFYWYQSGAINESMADVFGELVDQTNGTGLDGPRQRWLVGEEAPGGALRDMQQPTRRIVPGPRQPDRMRSRLYFADRRLRDNGGVHINSGVGNKAAYLVADGGRFNGRTVRGLGLERTGRIYLRALRMLTSGSDYADLARVLPQACRNLVRTPLITPLNCEQVRKAVLATEMLRQPRRATAPEAAACPARTTVGRRLFTDNLERPLGRRWRLGALWTRVPRARVLPPYATSGNGSMFGLNPLPARGEPANSSVMLRHRVRVPAGTRTFLRFDHARLFQHNFRTGARARTPDGGHVEVSLNGGRTWTDTAGLPWANGPRQRITLGPGPSGFRGFGGDSHGYQSSRADLSRFAGRNVRLRWTVSGNRTVAFDGWWLDDVAVYTCR
jgi:hypothetical protein